MKVISNLIGSQNKRQTIETVAYFTIHVALIALACLEYKIAASSQLAAVGISAVVFIALASFEHIYGPLVGYDHQGFTCASLSYAFGFFVNWLWFTMWPQDFEGFTSNLVLAIMFAFFGFVIQCIMIWEDMTD